MRNAGLEEAHAGIKMLGELSVTSDMQMTPPVWSKVFQRSKSLLISWLQSPSAVILEPKKIKSVTVSIVSPSVCHEVMGPDAMILVF